MSWDSFLKGVHRASDLLPGLKARSNRHKEDARSLAYKILRSAVCAAQDWFGQRSQTGARTLYGSASAFESLEAYARGACPQNDAPDPVYAKGVSGMLHQVILSHQTLGAMTFKKGKLVANKIGGMDNSVVADQLFGKLISSKRLNGRNVQIVTAIDIEGVKDVKKGPHPVDMLYQAADTRQARSSDKNYASRLLLKAAFEHARRLGTLDGLLNEARHSGSLHLSLCFRVKATNDLWKADRFRWDGAPLVANERDAVDIEVVSVLTRSGNVLWGAGDWRTQGKAGNQNMALRFVTGHGCFTLDSNQDGWVCETMKIPLLVRKSLFPRVCRNGKACGTDAAFIDDTTHRTVLAGTPEEIITESVSPVGSAEAVAESTFGRMVQRALDKVVGMRFHYGHPDVWNTHYVRSLAGALSKASPQINLSEDIFGGIAVLTNGYTSIHSDLLVWGKGREEVYLNALMFKHKISSGSGGVMRSRDLHAITELAGINTNYALLTSVFGYFLTSLTSFIMGTLLGLAILMAAISGQTAASLGSLYFSYASPWILQAGFLPVLLLVLDRCARGEISRVIKEICWPFLCVYHSTANEIVGNALMNSMLMGEAVYMPTGRGPFGGFVSWLTTVAGTWPIMHRAFL